MVTRDSNELMFSLLVLISFVLSSTVDVVSVTVLDIDISDKVHMYGSSPLSFTLDLFAIHI